MSWLMTDALHVLHVCRRFGPVGGMERYVWALTQALSELGHGVEVLCEVNLCQASPKGVVVHELGEVHPKPRWLAHIRFSQRVHAWLTANPNARRIIHSHERTEDHHITTFHGPPYAAVRELPLWKRVGLRVSMNLWLEKRELTAPHVRQVIPNSSHIRQQLLYYYPEVAGVMANPIAPGVSTCQARAEKIVDEQGGVIGFLGKEWKRKGLEYAVKIMTKLVDIRPKVTFLVAGFEATEAQHLFQGVRFSYQLLGHVNSDTFYAQLDVLLHPASKEPYGMVITEALSAGVAVVVADVCGAADDIDKKFGKVLPLHADASVWAQAIDTQLKQDYAVIRYQRSWQDVALEHTPIYQTIQQDP
ncbi:MAG: glycosyltransferase family 4 protein [Mariprofundaceae bacterium]|nr:glycosyltransferase family 4 protein [Mariprofundaceae bacterium]